MQLTGSQCLWAGLVLLLSYAVGSLSIGPLLARCFGSGDLRSTGSGGTGATNVLRSAGLLPAVATLSFDTLKGVVVVLACCHLLRDGQVFLGFAVLGVVLGHIFPFCLKFRGGKGAATTLGAELAIVWQLGVMLYAIWLAVAVVSRYSSLASLTATLAAPVLTYFYFHDAGLAWLFFGLFAIVASTHRENIRRLLAGQENKLTLRRTPGEQASRGGSRK